MAKKGEVRADVEGVGDGLRQFKRDLLEEHRELVTLGAVTPDALAEGRELR